MIELHIASRSLHHFIKLSEEENKRRTLVRLLPQIQSKMQWRVAGKEFAAAVEWVKTFINFNFTAALAAETFVSAVVSLSCVPVVQHKNTRNYHSCYRVNSSQKPKMKGYTSPWLNRVSNFAKENLQLQQHWAIPRKIENNFPTSTESSRFTPAAFFFNNSSAFLDTRSLLQKSNS